MTRAKSMRLGVVSVVSFVVVACSQTQLEQLQQSAAPLFNNGGFETGDFTSWSKRTYLNPDGLLVVPPTASADLRLTDGGRDFTFVRTNAVVESQLPAGLDAGPNVPRWPRFGTSSVVINEWGSTAPSGQSFHQGANNNVNSIRQSMATTAADVDPADGKVHVRFVLAPVLEAAGHTPALQPYFYVEVRNASRGNAVLYSNFNFANQTGVPWLSQGSGNNALLYTPWVIFDVAPEAGDFTVGETLEVEVYAAGCEPGGHSGTAYVDGFGAVLPSLSISKTAPARANIDTDITYTFTVENHLSGFAPNVVADEVLPPYTTFVSMTTPPGASCTSPAVGATGTVQCTFGWLNPGASAQFTVTVRNHPPTTEGTATASTTTTITDSTKTWTVNAHRGYTAFVTSGPQQGQQAIITSNTATQLTLNPALPGALAVGNSYKVVNPPGHLGTATSGGNDTLTQTGANWRDNQWVGWNVILLAGTGAVRTRFIESNTSNTLTVSSNWGGGNNPTGSTVFAIVRPVDSIINGNYGIAGPTVSRLLGPARETRIEAGTVFADLAVTMSDGVPAVLWGGATTYTIVVTNNGPSTATNATVTNTLPAQIASATWTCVGAGGGTCPANGSGSMNHSVTLPAGATVTYTVSATMIAGAGTGSVTNLVTVGMPAGVVDPFPASNSASDTNALTSTLRALTVNKAAGSTGTGTVSSSPAAIACGPACASQAANFADGQQVTLTAVAVAGNTFLGWSGGGCSGTAPTCTVTMSQAQTVTVSFTSCGNATREAGEGCDDGNFVNNDGCSSTCLIEDTRPCNAAMPGLVGNPSCASGVCDTVGNGAPGVCEPAATCGNGTREANEGCDDGNTAVNDGCNATCRIENGTTCNASAPGLTGNTSCASGICDTLGNVAPGRCEAPNVCGNGVREATEGCDDGNTAAGDGCNASCRIENGTTCNASMPGVVGNASCASGICDTLGNVAPGRCEAPNVCGNGVREATEGCDDGNTAAGDGCNAACRIENGATCNASMPGVVGNASCASGICDTLGNLAPGRCEAPNVCGNGVREATEGCDDGNTASGDGCNLNCRIETGSTCNASMPGLTGSSSCASGICDTAGNAAPGRCENADLCGNGTREANEGCDDGNTAAGDGCNATCLVENTRPCNASMPGLTGSASCVSGVCDATGGSPGTCEPANLCGNGSREAGEGCDDGNTTAGDGCSATCFIENTRPCNASMPGATGNSSCASGVCDATGGAPGVCEPVNTCGNGAREAGEGCDDGNTTAGDGCNATCFIENTRPCNASMPGATGNGSCSSGVCDATGGAPGVCEPANTCGNNVREAGEGCDDGNTTAGDGCSTACLVENGGACNASMPGATGNASCVSGLCNTSGGAPGVCRPNNVCGNGLREAGEGCDDSNTTAGDGCSATCLIETGRTCNASMPGLTGNGSCASGVCDATGGAPGTCEPVDTCGNGTREATEGCDDGNTTAADGCSATCLVESGGTCNASMPGVTGNASCASGVCNTSAGMPGTCQNQNVCGNGTREAGEGCDDGNTTASDGCSATCLIENGGACNATTPGTTGNASCASGLCDTSGGAPGVCRPTNTCGNGAREAGEGCDDGNTTSGDGCSGACLIENGRTCNANAPGATGNGSCASMICDTTGGAPGTCEPANTCGNGAREAAEGCDDGNTTAGDGCSATCLIENGRTCNATSPGATGNGSCASGVCDATGGAPGSCEPANTCGNGAREAGEGCDDGNTTAGDGCTAACLIETGRTCNASTPGLTGNASCADGSCDTSAGAPGRCAGQKDSDGDGVDDAADLDDDNDGITDVMEDGPSTDTDGDGVPDRLDLDSDGDGILDAHEAGHRQAVGSTGALTCAGGFGRNGLCDALETGAESGTVAYTTPGVETVEAVDTDGDGVPDFRDLDTDDDGISDLVEGSSGCADADLNAICDGADTDGDGITGADTAPTTWGTSQPITPPDADKDGVPDFRDLDSDDDGITDLVEGDSGCADADSNALCDGADGDGDGLRESVDKAPSRRGTTQVVTPPDTDGDGVKDFRDLDSDDDALSDLYEGGTTCADADKNGRCDGGDRDGDGLTDDTDGVPDRFGGGPTKKATVPDTDNDGAPDYRDVDSDGDGVFDIVFGGRPRLDANGDGRIDPGPDADGDGVRDVIDTDSQDFGGLPPPGQRVIGGGCACSSGEGSTGSAFFMALIGLVWFATRRGLQRRSLTPRAAPVRRAAGALVSALVVLVASAGWAQTSTAIDVQQLKPGPGRYDLLNVLSTQTCGAGCMNSGLWIQYVRNPLLITDLNGQRLGALVDNQLTADLLHSWGITDSFDLGVHLPLVVNNTGSTDIVNAKYVGGGWSFGAGDLRVIPRLRFWEAKDKLFSFGFALPIVLPTGRTDAFMGGGFIGVQPRLLGGFMKDAFRVDVNLGVNVRRVEVLQNIVAGHEFAWATAGEYRILIGNHPVSFVAGLHGVVGLTSGERFAGNRVVEVDVGVKSTLKNVWTAGITVGRGIVSGVGSPDIRVAANLAWTPMCSATVTGPADRDGDRIPDAEDQCPAEPEDFDCFKDDDGCPDPDNDQDGVKDAADLCPLEKETINGFKDDDGCPEKDSDKDGIIDDKDKCPLVAETVNQLQDDDGCPEIDTDKDGLYDFQDRCPTEPEDKDGFEDDDGCPDPDNDKDGVLDVSDKCPLVPETINGVEDTDGCPDKGETKVKLEGNKIVILDKVYFATSKDVILERSFNLLTQVASTLKAHAELAKIRVEGHTDSQADDVFNLDLSQRRANSVKKFLIERGVDAGRLDAVGYGEARPVADNKTPAGREMNRRVEFVIVDD